MWIKYIIKYIKLLEIYEYLVLVLLIFFGNVSEKCEYWGINSW